MPTPWMTRLKLGFLGTALATTVLCTLLVTDGVPWLGLIVAVTLLLGVVTAFGYANQKHVSNATVRLASASVVLLDAWLWLVGSVWFDAHNFNWLVAQSGCYQKSIAEVPSSNMKAVVHRTYCEVGFANALITYDVFVQSKYDSGKSLDTLALRYVATEGAFDHPPLTRWAGDTLSIAVNPTDIDEITYQSHNVQGATILYRPSTLAMNPLLNFWQKAPFYRRAVLLINPTMAPWP